MKKVYSLIAIALVTALLLCSCAEAGHENVSQPVQSAEEQSMQISAEEISVPVIDDFADDSKTAVGDFAIEVAEGGEYEQSNGVYTLKTSGEYTLSGSLAGQIIVDAAEDSEVKIILDGVSVTCSDSAPILVKCASEVTIRSEEGSYNTITDARTGDPDAVEESGENYDAAIYAECDLKLSGKGTLIVVSSYDNGIKTKDDLTIKNVSLKVTSPGNALKGNDSVTVKSGSLILTSTASDGVKTANSDISSKGNRRGTVTISGGTVVINAACDGISAAYDVVINEDESQCSVSVYTASYAGTGEAGAYSELYLILPNSLYSKSSDYYAYFYGDDDSDGSYVKFEYETMVYSGRTQYYGLKCKAPTDYSNVIFGIIPSGETPGGESFTSATSGGTVNRSMNAFLVTSADSEMQGDWVNLTSGSGSTKTSFSSKGIKAENSVTISAGTVIIKSMDDGIHANYGETLGDGTRSSGDVTISGGGISVTAADDGIHADGTLTISGGNVNVAESHEGLEANVVSIEGGSVTIYASDDGINACSGGSAPLVSISGGRIEVATPSGDTDAIDSNGSFTMTGGIAIIKGGASMGGMAGSVDVDRSLTVTGGTIVALGGICETPGSGSVNTYISSSASFSAGDYSIVDSSGNVIVEFSLSSSYSSIWTASESYALNGSYSILKGASNVVSWEQTSSTVGSSGGGFNPGGGGRPGGGRR